MTSTTPHDTRPDPRCVAAWLDGYATGEHVGASPASPLGRALWTEGYDAGHADGIAAGRRQVEAELAARWAGYRAELLARAGQPSYADLCDRRARLAAQAGHHDTAAIERARAARARSRQDAMDAMPGPFESAHPLPAPSQINPAPRPSQAARPAAA
ncbi:hypothetical protein GCM10027059_41990 [Myceligenerans halotolerans]